MRGRILRGAGVFQDHSFGKWPQCKPPKSYGSVDENMVFDVEWDGRSWECRADGFGLRTWKGEAGAYGYGNGSIIVWDRKGVRLIGPRADIGESE